MRWLPAKLPRPWGHFGRFGRWLGITLAASLVGVLVSATLAWSPWANSDGSTSNGGATTSADQQTATATPASATFPIAVEIRMGVVRLQRGFFLRNGLIVTTPVFGNSFQENTWAVWTQNGNERASEVTVLSTWPVRAQVELVNLTTDDLAPAGTFGIRPAANLRRGEVVSARMSSSEELAGRVRAIGVKRSLGKVVVRNALVLSRVSTQGDEGAPVLDAKGRVVAMIVGQTADETIAIPIEDIRDTIPVTFQNVF